MELVAVHAGVDLAKSVDYTAITIAEVLRRPREGAPPPRAPYSVHDIEHEVYYHVQDIAQFPHGVPWKEQATMIAALLAAVRARLLAPHTNPYDYDTAQLPERHVYIDATGLGSSMMDLIRQALDDHRETRDVSTYPVVFLSGQREYNWDTHTVGKTHLFRRLSALMATQRLELPKSHKLTPVLLREIAAFRFTIDRDGHETMGAESSEHDDILTSLALCCMIEPFRSRAIPFEFAGL